MSIAMSMTMSNAKLARHNSSKRHYVEEYEGEEEGGERRNRNMRSRSFRTSLSWHGDRGKGVSPTSPRSEDTDPRMGGVIRHNGSEEDRNRHRLPIQQARKIDQGQWRSFPGRRFDDSIFDGLRIGDRRFHKLRFNDSRYDDRKFDESRFNESRFDDPRFDDLHPPRLCYRQEPRSGSGSVKGLPRRLPRTVSMPWTYRSRPRRQGEERILSMHMQQDQLPRNGNFLNSRGHLLDHRQTASKSPLPPFLVGDLCKSEHIASPGFSRTSFSSRNVGDDRMDLEIASSPLQPPSPHTVSSGVATTTACIPMSMVWGGNPSDDGEEDGEEDDLCDYSDVEDEIEERMCQWNIQAQAPAPTQKLGLGCEKVENEGNEQILELGVSPCATIQLGLEDKVAAVGEGEGTHDFEGTTIMWPRSIGLRVENENENVARRDEHSSPGPRKQEIGEDRKEGEEDSRSGEGGCVIAQREDNDGQWGSGVNAWGVVVNLQGDNDTKVSLAAGSRSRVAHMHDARGCASGGIEGLIEWEADHHGAVESNDGKWATHPSSAIGLTRIGQEEKKWVMEAHNSSGGCELPLNNGTNGYKGMVHPGGSGPNGALQDGNQLSNEDENQQQKRAIWGEACALAWLYLNPTSSVVPCVREGNSLV